MDSIICLEHLSSLFHNIGFGFFVLGDFKDMYEIFGLFLLLAFGFKSLYSVWFPTNPKLSKSKYIKVAEKSGFGFNYKSSLDGLEKEKNGRLDASALRKMIQMERSRANEARAEVEREREASATAAEESMAMIQRLQSERSSIEMEWSHYRRLAEAKRAHDEEVIQSLKWLVMRYEAEMALLQRSLKSCCVGENVPMD